MRPTIRSAVFTRLTPCLMAAAMLTAACGDSDDDNTDSSGTSDAGAASVTIAAPADGSTIEGNVVTLELDASDVEIVAPDGDTSGDTAHFHVFVDTPPVGEGEVIPKAANIIHSADATVAVTGLMPGEHTFVAVLGDGTHTRLGDAEAEITVEVEGPGLQASAGAGPFVAGQPINIDVEVEGVDVVKPDGDTSGATGHFHVFVDREPVAAGLPIPTGDPTIIHSAASPVVVPNLAAGEHTLWVVLGDGAHVAFDPPVMHKLTITVT